MSEITFDADSFTVGELIRVARPDHITVAHWLDFWKVVTTGDETNTPNLDCSSLQKARDMHAKETDMKKNRSRKVQRKTRSYEDVHAENEREAQSLGYPNLISMQAEQAAEQHPEIKRYPKPRA